MYQRQVSFTEATTMAFNKYCCLLGRASRSEFWWFTLFSLSLSAIFDIPIEILEESTSLWDSISLADQISINTSSYLIDTALLLPSLGLTIRRLHDIGKGGGWIFINLIPLVGQIIFLVWLCKNSEPTDNRFGPVPNIVE